MALVDIHFTILRNYSKLLHTTRRLTEFWRYNNIFTLIGMAGFEAGSLPRQLTCHTHTTGLETRKGCSAYPLSPAAAHMDDAGLSGSCPCPPSAQSERRDGAKPCTRIAVRTESRKYSRREDLEDLCREFAGWWRTKQ